MPELPFDPAHLKAIIFDLDGTLYRQDSLRLAMLVRLLKAHATRPFSGIRVLRTLGAYRRAQEHLRETLMVSPDLAKAQIQLTCARTKEQPEYVEGCVSRWMEYEPLAILARHMQLGLFEFLTACKARKLSLAVLSDYPAEAKLNALGLLGLFDVIVTAQSPGVGAFKPHPRGLLLTADRLGVSPSDCVYVGDRAAVDGPAAAAAGMACFILTQDGILRREGSWIPFDGYLQLEELLLEGARRGSAEHRCNALNRSSTAAPQPVLRS